MLFAQSTIVTRVPSFSFPRSLTHRKKPRRLALDVRLLTALQVLQVCGTTLLALRSEEYAPGVATSWLSCVETPGAQRSSQPARGPHCPPEGPHDAEVLTRDLFCRHIKYTIKTIPCYPLFGLLGAYGAILVATQGRFHSRLSFNTGGAV